jgi:hypothetical protein
MDATVAATFKKNALYSYRENKSYQPINTSRRVIEHSRRLLVRISGNCPSGRLLIDMRRRIFQLAASEQKRRRRHLQKFQ